LVSVGISHDTAQFAVAAIERWWNTLGRKRFPGATRLLSTAATRTETGLEVHACLDSADYPDKLKITDAQLAHVLIKRDSFHGEWNYQIFPRT